MTPEHPLHVKGVISASRIHTSGTGAGGFYANKHLILTETDNNQIFGISTFDNVYAGRTHQFTGSIGSPGHITASGNLSASGKIESNHLILAGNASLDTSPSLQI